MGTIGLCGFETGDTLEFQGVSGTASVQSTTKRTGAYALQINPTTTGVGSAIIAGFDTTGAQTNWDAATVYHRFYFRAGTLPASSEEIAQIRDTADTLKMSVRVSSAGKLSTYKNDGTTQIAEGTKVLVTGTWYKIGVSVGTGTSASYLLEIDGVTEISGTVTSSGLGTVNCGFLYLGKVVNRNGGTVNFYYDDVLVSDTSMPPAGGIVTLYPNADGNANLWDATTGTPKANQVKEVPIDAVTYLTSPSSFIDGDAQTLGLDSCATAGITGQINSIKSVQALRRDGASNGACRLRIRIGSTDHDTPSNVATGNGYLVRGFIYTVNPDTGVAFTLADLDGTEVGVLTKSANRSRISVATLMVDFQPPSPIASVTGTTASCLAVISAFGALAGVTGGGAFARATGTLVTGMISTVATTTSATATLTGSGSMAATAAATSTALGDLHGHGEMIAGASGGAFARSTGSGTGALASTAYSTSHTYGLLNTPGSIVGGAGSVASCFGVLSATGELRAAGYVLGGSSGVLAGSGSLSGLANSTSFARATITSTQAGAQGDASSVSSMFGLLSAVGEMRGTAWASAAAFAGEPQAPAHVRGFYENLGFVTRGRFRDNVALIQSLPTQYDNEEFTPPDDELWCRLTLLIGTSMQADFGDPDAIRSRTTGILIAQLFVPLGMSDQPALAMAGLIDAEFKTLTVDGVTYRKPYVSQRGRSGKWHQVNVTCPFYADDVA